MKLSNLLSKISHDEVCDARNRAKKLASCKKSLAARCSQLMNTYPAMEVIISLPVRRGHDLFTKEKLEGYRSACHLIATLAEISGNDALANALVSVTDQEILSAAEEISSTDKMNFAAWFRSCSQNYYGYVLGMWEEFMNLLDSGKNDQSLAHLIVVGGLIIIAENREGKNRCFPNT